MKKALNATFRRMRNLYLFALCASIVFFSAQACSEYFHNLNEQIEQRIKQLEYTDKTIQNFIRMVEGWKDKQGRCILVGWSEKLAEAKDNCEQNKISKKHLVGIEADVVAELGQRIKKEISFSENYFELDDVVKHRQTQCLGYTQLFYILGNSIGLEVKSVNIKRMRTGKLPVGSAHIAGIVTLSDGKIMIVDLVPNGFISTPFILEEQFEKADTYLELKDKSNPLDLDRQIQILGERELVAYIYNNRASIYIKQGQFEEAVSKLNKAIDYHPKYAEAYYNRGIALRHFGYLNGAAEDYTTAIELKPDFTEAYANRGIIYSKLGQFDKAIADYNKAIEINSDFANLYYNRGIAYSKLGQMSKAIADYDRAIKLDGGLVAKTAIEQFKLDVNLN